MEWYVLPADGPVTSVAFDEDRWILRGAVSSVPYVAPLHVTETTPLPGTAATAPMNINAVEIEFSGAITYTATDFSVTGSVSGPRPFTATYNGNELMTLSFGSVLTAGETWTVQIADSVIAQAGGFALDGELDPPGDPSSLPSGDGIPGGDAVLSFFVAHTGDFDVDGDTDQEDFGFLQRCLAGPGVLIPPGCGPANLDHDNDVDLNDFGVFQPCMSGPNNTPGPGCG
jgi:hypothetical protein